MAQRAFGGSDVSTPAFAATGGSASRSLAAWFAGLGKSDAPTAVAFWTDVDAAAPNSWRFRDRVKVGAAVDTNDTRSGGTQTNWGSYANWAPRDSDMVVMSSRGAIAFAGMTRSSDSESVSNPPAPVGAGGFAINDTSTVGRAAWALYADVQHEPNASIAGAAATYGLEVAGKNKGTNISGTPYAVGFGVHGIWLSAGGDTTYGGSPTFPSNSGITFRKNASTWNVGILFGKDAITGTDGTTGTGNAIMMAKGHTIRWESAAGVLGSRIRSDVSIAGRDTALIFDNFLAYFQNNAGKRIFSIAAPNTGTVSNGVNYVSVTGGATGIGVTVGAAGDDTDIDLILTPKGAGQLKVGLSGNMAANASIATALSSVGPTGSHTTVQEWLQLKNSAGTVRYIPCF